MSTNTALDQIKNRVEGHTEGPWFAHQEYIDMGVEDAMKTITNSPERYAGKFIASVGLDSEVKATNAELIAAAPKLLAALEAVEALAEEWRYKGEFGWGAWQEGHGPGPDGQVLDSAAGEIRQAIEEALR